MLRQVLNNFTSSGESSDANDSLIIPQYSAESTDEYQIQTKKPLKHFQQDILIDNGPRIIALETIFYSNNKPFYNNDLN